MRTASLDGLVFRQGLPAPDVIKMDLEGGEVLALPGARRLMDRIRPLLLIELHGPKAARAAWDALLRARYTVCEMRRGYPMIASVESLGWKAYIVGVPQGFGRA